MTSTLGNQNMLERRHYKVIAEAWGKTLRRQRAVSIESKLAAVKTLSIFVLALAKLCPNMDIDKFSAHVLQTMENEDDR